MDPITLATVGEKVRNFFSNLFKSPFFWAGLLILAVGTGTYFYLKDDKAQAVTEAVAGADQQATLDTYRTKEEAEAALQPYVDRANQKQIQTIKEYEIVRREIHTYPEQDRQAYASPVILGTLNNLERMSRGRENENRVPDAQLPSTVAGMQSSAEGAASSGND